MATKRKDGLWQETITINGKRKYFYGRTKAEILEKMKAFDEAQLQKKTFASIAEDWWYEHKEHVAPSTTLCYQKCYHRSIEYFGKRYIEDISAAEVDALLRSLKAQNYSKKIVSRQLNILNMIFNFAILGGFLKSNPCSAVKLPSGLQSSKRELPSDEDIRIVKSSEWLFPFFLLYTGCRKGEALALQYEDIDFDNKVIHVTKSVGFDGNKPFIKSPKTEAGNRDIVLLDVLAEKLPQGQTGLIFPNPRTGELYDSSKFTRDWQAWQRENDTDVTCHQLRHGFATILYEAGIEVKDAQYLMGHTSVVMTQDVYTHIRLSRQEMTAARLNNFLKKENSE